MRLCLERGANLASHGGEPLLWGACRKGFVEAATVLLDYGAAVDQTSQYGSTPLYIACCFGHCGAAKLCLERGADVDGAVNEFERESPLCIACWKNHSDVAKLLLEHGANIHRTDGEHDMTPLHLLCGVEMVRLCLERGADVDRALNAVTAYGRTPSSYARIHGRVVMAAWLDRIRAVGWKRHLSEPEYKLVVLRELAAKGRARRERAFDGKELVLDFLFPGHFFRSGPGDDDPRLPDELFSFIAGYYGDGGMTAEEEAALAAEAAARRAQPWDFLRENSF